MSTRSGTKTAAPQLEGRHLKLSVPCPGCTYDLRGVSATSQCPECGHDVATVIAAVIDPVSHQLPRLADPRAVGDGLVLVAMALSASVVFPLAGTLFAGAAALSGKSSASTVMFEAIAGLSAIIVFVGCTAGCWCLRPRPGGPMQGTAHRAVGEVGVGAVACGAGLVLFMFGGTLGIAGLLLAAIGLCGGLLGLRKVLLEAGRRCRVFRSATLRRQRIPTLVFAAALAALCLAGAAVAKLNDAPNADITLGALGLTVLTVLAVGLVYLTLNAVWIRHDLRQPPPALDELIG